jgi:hypothetical protein
MSSVSLLAAEYRRLRDGAAWKLLASDSAPVVLAILREHFGEGEVIPASALRELVRRDIDELVAQGYEKGVEGQGGASSYIARWLASGYLERRFLPNEREEHYELSLAAVSALALADRIARPKATATESRLATVVSLILKLEEETDLNPSSRIATLEVERSRIESRIEELKADRLVTLDNNRAVERTREIVSLAQELTGDFFRVGVEFERLNRELRHTLVENSANRGQVLEELFSGVDMIAESDAGRAFNGFYKLLMDIDRRLGFEAALESILSREFVAGLSDDERDFLAAFTDQMLDRGRRVHETQLRLARSLRDFVRSHEYLEKRRLTSLLDEAAKKAHALRDLVKPSARISYELDRTSVGTSSIGTWSLYDPALAWKPQPMLKGEATDARLEDIVSTLLDAEIDYRALKHLIATTLAERDQASIGEVAGASDLKQGLGSIVGLIDLGFKFGLMFEGTEQVGWKNRDDRIVHAVIPLIRFTKESIHGFE